MTRIIAFNPTKILYLGIFYTTKIKIYCIPDEITDTFVYVKVSAKTTFGNKLMMTYIFKDDTIIFATISESGFCTSSANRFCVGNMLYSRARVITKEAKLSKIKVSNPELFI